MCDNVIPLLHRNAWQKRQRSGCSRIYFPCPSFVPWHSGQHGQPLALPSGPKSMGTRRSRSCACTPSMLILFFRHTSSRSMILVLSWHHVVFRPCGCDCGVADRFNISISPSPLALIFCLQTRCRHLFHKWSQADGMSADVFS